MPLRSLWDFSLWLYACPGVSQACLKLQDDHGVDINMLMFAAWAGQVRGVRLSGDDATQVLAASRPWQEHVVVPVRQLRRQLRNSPGAATDPCLREILDAVKALELQAERAELDKAEALASQLFAGRPEACSPSMATDNLTRMLHAAGVPEHAAAAALPVFVRALREGAAGDATMRRE